MAAGVTDRQREVKEVAALVEAADPLPAKRRPYEKREAQISD
jgi:hypothetical protein